MFFFFDFLILVCLAVYIPLTYAMEQWQQAPNPAADPAKDSCDTQDLQESAVVSKPSPVHSIDDAEQVPEPEAPGTPAARDVRSTSAPTQKAELVCTTLCAVLKRKAPVARKAEAEEVSIKIMQALAGEFDLCFCDLLEKACELLAEFELHAQRMREALTAVRAARLEFDGFLGELKRQATHSILPHVMQSVQQLSLSKLRLLIRAAGHKLPAGFRLLNVSKLSQCQAAADIVCQHYDDEAHRTELQQAGKVLLRTELLQMASDLTEVMASVGQALSLGHRITPGSLEGAELETGDAAESAFLVRFLARLKQCQTSVRQLERDLDDEVQACRKVVRVSEPSQAFSEVVEFARSFDCAL